jgi:Family of unknown function (DUF5678)
MVLSEITKGPFSEQPTPSPDREKWEREQRAFFRLLGGLVPSHRGQYVAVRNGEVVAFGTDPVEVTLRAYADHGRQPIYVDLVADQPIAAIHRPH